MKTMNSGASCGSSMFELYSPILAIAFILYPWHLESSVCAYIVSPRLAATQGVGVRRGRVQLHWRGSLPFSCRTSRPGFHHDARESSVPLSSQ
jgi:hypothetical protein